MFARSGFTVGVAFVIFLFALNLECALLQRLHRVRLRRLMDRASAPCAGATRRAAR